MFEILTVVMMMTTFSRDLIAELQRSALPPCCTLMRDRDVSVELSVDLYQTALRQIPEDGDIRATALFLVFRTSNLLENIDGVKFQT
jgi:hypothetical protein